MAVRIRVRAELRHRWQAWTVIALLIGFAGGVVLTAAIPVALILANALAGGPGLVAGRLSPASVLGNE